MFAFNSGIEDYVILHGGVLERLRDLPDGSVQTCVTSPPYFGLRSYLPADHPDKAREIGTEKTPGEYVAKIVAVFRAVREVLADDGTLWLNIGDSYAGAGYSNHANTGGAQRQDGGKQRHLTGTGLKPKDLIGIPWMLAFALRADGWYLRQDIIWAKGTSGARREGTTMPESVKDRCTKAHEYIFLLSKGPNYYFDSEAIAEPVSESFASMARNPKASHKMFNGEKPKTGNRRSVWRVNTKPLKAAHFATFPPDLIEPCILAGAPEGGVVLDPFAGSGTTGMVALKHGRRFVGVELNSDYVELCHQRISGKS